MRQSASQAEIPLRRPRLTGQRTAFAEGRPRAKAELLAELKSYSRFGAPAKVKTANGIPYFINEFWTARQRQAHRLHEISYRACFKPQLPAFFIERLTRPGDAVYDPFMGRGTTAVEAALRGRIPYGNDINPLSRALTEPRISPPGLNEIARRLEEIPWAEFKALKRKDLLAFYHPKTLAQIEGLRLWLKRRGGRLDAAGRWIKMAALSRLTGHSPGFFSVYTLPPNQAVSIERQKKLNERSGQTPPFRDVPSLIMKKSQSLLSQGAPQAGQSLFLTEPSHNTPQLPDGSVQLTVTSPPFLDVADYSADNWLRCWFLDIDPKKIKITKAKSLDEWRDFIALTLRELSRVTCPGGHIAFEAGEVRGGEVFLDEHAAAAAAGLPLEILGVLIHRQSFTKTANCWGISNNKKGTNSNRIVLFRRK